MALVFHIPSLPELLPKSKPVFSKPIEITSFSYDSKRTFHPNRSELKRYLPDKLSGFFNSKYADLNCGREKFISKPEDYQEHLDGLVKSLSLLEKTNKPADFVTWRGILTKILATPFKPSDSWSFNVMRRGSTIYIEDDKSLKAQEKKYPKQAMYSYWGHRFEHMVMTGNDPTISLEDVFKEPVNTWKEFGIVLKGKLGQHRLIFGAEVDGLDFDGSTYVELKTSRVLKDASSVNQFYQKKLMTFWAQSFLAGIPKILIGFRSDSGIVKSIEYIEVNEIPRITRGKVSWCPETMLNFGTVFLDWLAKQMHQLPEELVYSMSCNGTSIELTESSHPPFVPKDFANAMYY